jgi:protein NrfD
MMEEILITARSNPHVDPGLTIWGWEIAVYLFLGGMTAGIMFFAAFMLLRNRPEQTPFATAKLALWAPLVLSLGMGTLFLDLEHKLYVFRFYTTFQPTSPMSWGSWILILVYPAAVLLILATLREGYPRLVAPFERLPRGAWVLDMCARYRRPIAMSNLPLAIALGIYTGILLSAFGARPFWNTGLLGPLFLISGLSSAAAVVILASRLPVERHLFARIDAGLLALELVVVVLLVINLATSHGVQLEAAASILGGAFTAPFWIYFFAVGVALPLLLEAWELAGRPSITVLAPALVLIGGYMLRQVMLEVGQASRWTHYASQFDPRLMELLQ